MTMNFAKSRRSTLGIEWELGIINASDGTPTNLGPELFEYGGSAGLDQRVSRELLENTIELVTGVHTTVGSALQDLDESLTVVERRATELGAALFSAGTHPFAKPDDQHITDSPRYSALIERTKWWGQQMFIYGIHVHVGITDKQLVVPIMNALMTWYPHILGISTSSPWWDGIATGYASNRTMIFQQLPTSGLPYGMRSWDEYQQVVADLITTDAITESNELRWDVRPSPDNGTIELRFADGVPTLTEIGAIAALSQCLVDWCVDQLEVGNNLPTLPPWFLKENKWRAARFGLEASIIAGNSNSTVSLREDLTALVEMLAPTAERLGCISELSAIGTIMDVGTSGQRQLQWAAAGATGKDVALALAAETESRTLRA